MEKEFIPYEQALALKELGFSEECLALYYVRTKGLHYGPTKELISNFTEDVRIAAPPYQQAFRWFREKYNYDGYFYSNTSYKFRIVIKKIFTMENLVDIIVDSPEEAELECLKKLIEIVKNV